jgi:ATP-binding cassette subfamily C protein
MSDIGESGNKLSGGQRQRIAIARALINGSQILLLDEAMSSLDPETAKEIENWILSQEQLTVISVTHKLESEELKKYDEILVLDNGCVAESGSYDELIKNDGLFSKMRMSDLEGI